MLLELVNLTGRPEMYVPNRENNHRKNLMLVINKKC